MLGGAIERPAPANIASRSASIEPRSSCAISSVMNLALFYRELRLVLWRFRLASGLEMETRMGNHPRQTARNLPFSRVLNGLCSRGGRSQALSGGRFRPGHRQEGLLHATSSSAPHC